MRHWRKAFAAQLTLARETARPVVVHSREAADDTAAMISEAGREGVLGVLHCHTGPANLAEAAIEAGWYLSFAGMITFKSWTDDGLLALVPAERVLVETDAPYLAPIPNRGKRNEPAFASLTLARLAQARGIPAVELGEITSANASRLFGLELHAHSR
jgi:TatD DNase family protein